MRSARCPSVRASSVLARDIALRTLQGGPKWDSQEKRVICKAGEGQCLPQECGLVSCLSLVNPLPLSPRQVTPSKVTQRETGRGTRWGKGSLTGDRGNERR